jgi:hypothetical protein
MDKQRKLAILQGHPAYKPEAPAKDRTMLRWPHIPHPCLGCRRGSG